MKVGEDSVGDDFTPHGGLQLLFFALPCESVGVKQSYGGLLARIDACNM